MARIVFAHLYIIGGLAGFTSCIQQGEPARQNGYPSNEGDTLGLRPHPDDVFSGDMALRQVYAQLAFGPRPTGSQASQLTGGYILAQLDQMDWAVSEQPFEYRGEIGRNLIARAGEAGGDLFLIGAHYDTRPVADNDPLDTSLPVPGANDGASGVAVLLELARVLDTATVQGEVMLVFFDAEDRGRLDEWEWTVGSAHFAETMTSRPTYVIIVDMVGDADQTIYFEANSDSTLREHLWTIAGDLGYDATFRPEVRHSILDDHIPFVNQGIPAVDIIDFDYPFWHTSNDTAEHVAPLSLERVGRVLEVFLERGGTYAAH